MLDMKLCNLSIWYSAVKLQKTLTKLHKRRSLYNYTFYYPKYTLQKRRRLTENKITGHGMELGNFWRRFIS
jgi:hypothetical protein